MNYSARDAGLYKRSELLSILVLTGFSTVEQWSLKWVVSCGDGGQWVEILLLHSTGTGKKVSFILPFMKCLIAATYCRCSWRTEK
jgi:hypothetical protein